MKIHLHYITFLIPGSAWEAYSKFMYIVHGLRLPQAHGGTAHFTRVRCESLVSLARPPLATCCQWR